MNGDYDTLASDPADEGLIIGIEIYPPLRLISVGSRNLESRKRTFSILFPFTENTTFLNRKYPVSPICLLQDFL